MDVTECWLLGDDALGGVGGNAMLDKFQSDGLQGAEGTSWRYVICSSGCVVVVAAPCCESCVKAMIWSNTGWSASCGDVWVSVSAASIWT